ncbi:hypothetical protein D9615_001969 [Tricholomella constricta]|uniref:Uncharacterized protein n=1 Tax=Tricholomella constricta TaxID=117010 RepID=A0A8H5MAM3_9AGAR|nr:hypothetical protein D9615_001969 [Tricholomella constricta]
MPPNTRFSSYIKPGLLDQLPLDLKREIFEIAAYIHPPFALRLAVVSREVQPWAERIIYRELFFNGQRISRQQENNPNALEKFTVALEARPASFFAEYVKSLHFDGNFISEHILPIIQACTGITNFGLYAALNDGVDTDHSATEEVYRAIHTLPLETLFISTSHLTLLLQQCTPASSCLLTLPRLGLTDGCEYPAARFPALTHLALVPGSERAVPPIYAALANPRIVSVIATFSYAAIPRHNAMLRALRDIRAADPRLVLFTLPVSPTRYIEDDLWDLANEFPDEEQPVSYLKEIPGPKILSFEELMALGL